jgi:hypothetical protein
MTKIAAERFMHDEEFRERVFKLFHARALLEGPQSHNGFVDLLLHSITETFAFDELARRKQLH